MTKKVVAKKPAKKTAKKKKPVAKGPLCTCGKVLTERARFGKSARYACESCGNSIRKYINQKTGEEAA